MCFGTPLFLWTNFVQYYTFNKVYTPQHIGVILVCALLLKNIPMLIAYSRFLRHTLAFAIGGVVDTRISEYMRWQIGKIVLSLE